ncbi:RAQPRD family integrative conjugative element protein [Erwinia sp. S63]|uniref:RAQPRD family integrative conjugative element protein n=1 Tax=Erwinia sp. S63 TaxID=2769341 RepID=UPI0025729E0D|nr:RAQPRD family integrative conjugative element protein [Erwinia sp. S63]
MNKLSRRKRYVKFFIISFSLLVVSAVNASELDELATTQRLLDQVQLSLDRARTVAAQSDPK